MSEKNKFTNFSRYSVNAKYGIWWFRILGYGLIMRAPWNKPLFSERYGYRKVIKFKNWRIGVLKP